MVLCLIFYWYLNKISQWWNFPTPNLPPPPAPLDFSSQNFTEEFSEVTIFNACFMPFMFDSKWQSQITGKGGLISALNSRLYIIHRLQSHLSKKAVLKVVDGIFTSKLRYGLHLLGKVRTTSSDPECAEFKAIQICQNNLMRSLNGSKIKDMISISTLLKKFGMLSVN